MSRKAKNQMRDGLVQRGDGRWTAVISLGWSDPDPVTGKRKLRQRWVSLGKCTRAEAKIKRAELIGQAQKGELVEPTKITVGDWLKTWMAEAIAPIHRPNTTFTYQQIIDKHLAPALGTVPLQQLRAGHLQRYYGEQRKAGLSDASLGLHHAIISGALKAAHNQQLVSRNVARMVQGRPRAKGTSREEAKKHCWSIEEARAFLRAAQQTDAQQAAFFALALDSGARKGELCALRWADVDLDAGTIVIDRTLITRVTAPTFGPTKNGDARTVSLNGTTVALLREHKRQQAETKMANRTTYQDLGLVFAKGWTDLHVKQQRLGYPVSIVTLAKQMDRIVKAAGVRRIKVHGLRHTSATLLLAAGVPVHIVATRLGHKNATITLSTYAHCLPSHQQAAAATLGAILHG